MVEFSPMKKLDLFRILLSMSCVSSVNAEVSITEIMTNNVATIVSDKYNYDGYVEFFNNGDNVDLKGWTVTSVKEGVTDWRVKLDSSHILPKGYSLLFFGKSETSSLSASKINSVYAGRVGNKLSTDEGSITFEKDGKKISISYPAQRPHLSYCNEGFMMPTPGKENDGLVTSLSNRVASPAFKSSAPGLYDDKLSVELECPTDGAVIYYTINGDAPTPEKGERYKEPINIDSTTALRARAYKDGMLYSEILTGSYILPDKFYNYCKGVGDRLPIVSLVGNDEDIFGKMLGIYVEGTNGIKSSCTPVANYNQDWMRSANFEYILDGKVVDNQEIEIGVYGGCTRIHNAKSLKLKANKRSGKNKMYYNSFFANRSYKKTKSLALRNGGNGYSYVQPRWRDMFIQSLGDGMNLDKQAAQPVAYYLNGKFYGMMILTERTDEDYVYHNYGLDEDEIDLLTANFGDYECESGTREAYDKMIDYVSKSYADPDFYDNLDTHMDIDEYIDYQILEQYVGNTDWVTHNIKVWRKHDGGRFRWIVFDTDFGLSKATSLDTCMLDFTTKPIRAKEPMLVLLKSCLKNEDFRWRFLDQYLDRIENQFTDKKIDTKIDSLWSMTQLDMCATIRNSGPLDCPGNPKVYDEEIEKMRAFAKDRKGYVIKQLKKEFGLGDDTVTIKVRTVFPNSETPKFSFLLNKREHSEAKFNTTAYSNERVKLEPKVPVGYKIQKWAINDTTLRTDKGNRYSEKSLTTVAKSDLKVTIYFEYDENYKLPSNLCLNEVCASNESTLDENNAASDWIEVYNGADEDVDIAGLILENETKAARTVIPTGSEETVVPAHGYKLLWADKSPEAGPLHLNFKLGAAASERIVLRANYRDGEVELSSVSYSPHETDESYGRTTDGDSTMKVFAKCIDEKGNKIITATPLTANGSIVCPDDKSGVQKVVTEDVKRVFTKGKTLYVREAKGKDIRVYSLLGNLVADKKSESDMFSMSIPTAGIYIVKIDSECVKIVVD
ncbi:MAG: CotH kinase family protein [Paludibacteraceae bacterium]|nr:CotH kinase family protein [Paludibacteraceae bacterium]